MKAQSPKVQVVSRLLEMARLIRKRGTPDEADAVLPYERQLQHDLDELTQQKELSLPPVPSEKEQVAA